MKILVLCETSNEIAGRFRDQGHDVTSCDLLPNDVDQTNHWQVDVKELLETLPDDSVDLIIAHPPCTALAVSGNAWYGQGMAKHEKRLEAMQWTEKLWRLCLRKGKRVAFENPVGVLGHTSMGKASQYIQPWQHGHPESKKTGLWLHNLPKLKPTCILPKPECGHWNNQTPSGQNKLGPSPDRWKIRSKTYDGIAQAIVDQWGLSFNP